MLVDGAPVALTAREFDLLYLLASNPGRAFSRDYLLDRLWRDDFEGFDRTVDTHILRLRRKLGGCRHGRRADRDPLGRRLQVRAPGSRRADDGMRALKWLVTLPWRVIRFPFRLYRRKISVQLIFSHVLVVMLSIILLEAAIIGISIAVFREFEDDAFTEYSIAEFASSAAIVMAADPAVASLGWWRADDGR